MCQCLSRAIDKSLNKVISVGLEEVFADDMGLGAVVTQFQVTETVSPLTGIRPYTVTLPGPYDNVSQ